MSDLIYGILSVFGGLLLGLVFFGSLRIVVHKLLFSKKAHILLLLSFFLRMCLAVLCFYFLLAKAPLKLTCSFLLGFLLMKVWFLCTSQGKGKAKMAK